MKILNIRVYRVIFPHGGCGFESKNKDGRGAFGAATIQQLVEEVKSDVGSFLCNGAQVNIVLPPTTT